MQHEPHPDPMPRTHRGAAAPVQTQEAKRARRRGSHALLGAALASAALGLGGLACGPSAMTASDPVAPSRVSPPGAEHADGPETRTYVPPPADLHSERVAVRFGDPRRLADLLTEVFDLHHGAGNGDVRAVLVDGANDELVVVATDAGVAAVRRLLAPACTDAGAEDARVEVVPLAHARANSVVHTLTPMAPRGARIVPDEPTNALVISGSAAERATVIALAKSLDVSPAVP